MITAIVSIDTGDGVSAKGRILFTDYRPTYRPSVDRQVDRVSTTLDRYVGRVSIAGIDRHSTAGAFSTHDPIYENKQPTEILQPLDHHYTAYFLEFTTLLVALKMVHMQAWRALEPPSRIFHEYVSFQRV